jgi:multiple sugar transport system substrate-binding protein
MSSERTLKGITWNHSRAFPPLVASAQRFEEEHRNVRITWSKRSLDDFGHGNIIALADRFDLLIVDHPMMGVACQSRALLDLKSRLPHPFLKSLADHSVGQSYPSYLYDDSLFALPIDAATPTASYRPDILARLEIQPPRTWSELVALARKGLVVMPGFPADLFLNFLALCVSRGALPCAEDDRFIKHAVGMESLDGLRELACGMPEDVYRWNPIDVYEVMASQDRFAYCPFAYSYSNYSRHGFGKNILLFAAPVALEDGQAIRTVLGGTGLAISAKCEDIETALEYASYVAGETCQRTLYGLSGGQPAHRCAWLDKTLNSVSNDFFLATLDTINRAYVRPRYPGYIELQAQAGLPIQDYLRGQTDAKTVLETIDRIYRETKQDGRHSYV